MNERDEANRIIEKYKNEEFPEYEVDISTSNSSRQTDEHVEEPRKQLWLRRLIHVIPFVFIAAGILVFLYPILSQKWYEDKQIELQDEMKEIVLENMRRTQEEALKNQVVEQTPPSTNLIENNSNTQPVPTAFVPVADEWTDLPLEQEDNENITEASPTTTRSTLQGQTLFGSIEIKSMNLFYAVVEGTTKSNLAAGIGHMIGTADIGAVGNCAIAGHRGGTTGRYFKNIDMLSIGDTILMTNLQGESFEYIVYDMFIVEPVDVWVARDSGDGTQMLTLITCENDGEQRLIVRARVAPKEE